MRSPAIRFLSGPLVCALFAFACLLAGLAGVRAEGDGPRPRHGIAMHGAPALPEGFAHLPYANPDAPRGGRLNLGFQGTFDSLNPFNIRAGSTAQGLNINVFQTLMTRSLDEPFTLYGQIAESIETDGGRTYATFRLNPKARFSDGKPVTADDVLFTFELIKAKGRPPQRDTYRRVVKAEKLDEHAVRFDFSGLNDRELPLTMGLMPVLPRHATDADNFEQTTLTPPVGSGPYVVAEIRPGERLTLRKNPDYWGKDLPVHRGLFNFDEIRIDYFRDANTLFEAFSSGLVDYRVETDPARWATGYDIPAVREGRIVKESIRFGLPKGLDTFVFNTRNPLFADIRVREALALMFDFEWINANLYSGLYRRTRSLFDDSELASTGRPADALERALLAPFPDAVRPDIMEGRWAPPVTDGTGRDRQPATRALELFEQAGYTIREGALRKRGSDEPFAFEIMVRDRQYERLALNYAASLRRIGVVVRVRVVDDVQYQRRRQRFEFDMMPGIFVATPSPGNEQFGRWGSRSAAAQGSFNLAGVASPAADAMIEALLAARGKEEFVAAVRALDRVILSGFYFVPLFHSDNQWIAMSTRIGRPAKVAMFGFQPNSFSAPFWSKAP